MILKIFSPKNLAKKTIFDKAKLCKNFIITLTFEKNALFSPNIVKVSEKL
jgi:hypothetical protein